MLKKLIPLVVVTLLGASSYLLATPPPIKREPKKIEVKRPSEYVLEPAVGLSYFTYSQPLISEQTITYVQGSVFGSFEFLPEWKIFVGGNITAIALSKTSADAPRLTGFEVGASKKFTLSPFINIEVRASGAYDTMLGAETAGYGYKNTYGPQVSAKFQYHTDLKQYVEARVLAGTRADDLATIRLQSHAVAFGVSYAWEEAFEDKTVAVNLDFKNIAIYFDAGKAGGNLFSLTGSITL